ncbi:MAG TPA: efflux RND transporter periplasmic adaptor subunit [Bacteroidia bacterium]|nr:efflux RND transporter periplasmic adaptor subunit [Bacteroidia bacterium]
MAKNKKALKYIGITLVVLIILLTIAKSKGWIGSEDATKVSAEKASRQTIVETVSASGKVQPEVEVKMSADVSGEIVEMNIKEGDVVKKGTLLCKINPEIYVSNLDRTVASVNSSKANLENSKMRLLQTQSQFTKAELTFNRNKKLFDDGAISASDFETIKSAYEVAKAEVDAAQQSVRASEFGVNSADAVVKEAKENLNKTSIFAPVDGTISKLSVEKGERVVGTSQMAGTEIMRIANLNEMEVSVDVSENDIVRVHLNDTAIIDVDAYMDRKFKGIVTEIANSANITGQSTDQVTNFIVKVRILRESYQDLIPKENPAYSPFRPGMSATVEIQTKRVSNVVAVPIQAVTTRDTALKKSSKVMKRPGDEDENDSGESSAKTAKTSDQKINECVFLIQEEKAKMTSVKTGIQDNMYIEIVSGLKEGDQVATGPFSVISKTLKDGNKIKVVRKEELFAKEKK